MCASVYSCKRGHYLSHTIRNNTLIKWSRTFQISETNRYLQHILNTYCNTFLLFLSFPYLEFLLYASFFLLITTTFSFSFLAILLFIPSAFKVTCINPRVIMRKEMFNMCILFVNNDTSWRKPLLYMTIFSSCLIEILG